MSWNERARRIASALAMAALGVSISCASAAPAALTSDGARVHVSTASEVSQCRSLGDFIAMRPSARGGLPGYLGSEQVRNAAGAKGATDIVFDEESRADVVGHAYQCQ